MNYSSLLRFLYRHYPLRKGKHKFHKWVSTKIHGFALSKDELGHELLLDLNNHIDSDIYLRGSYEKELMTLLAKWVSKQGATVFIDVGANIGIYTLFFARQSSIEKVHAFEPDPKNYAHLLANVFLNELSHRVNVHNLALSHHNGQAEFYLSRQQSADEFGKLNTGTSSLDFLPLRHHKAHSVSVEVARADDVLSLENQNLLVKIDVEGHELGVLQGMEQTLRSNNCLLFVEVWKQNKDASKKVDQLLSDFGYSRHNLPQFEATDNRLYSNKPFVGSIFE